jgi:uncharacterized phage protein (TIGR01671 family)
MNGQWVTGDLAHSLDGKLNIFGFVEEEEGKIGFTGAHKIDPSSVCQFTGFLDKNGKEIYEGDVLRSDKYPYSCLKDNERDNYYVVVYYCEERACFGTETAKNPSSDVRGISDGILDDVEREKKKNFEVVGNIHEEKWQQYGEYFKTEEEKEADND